MAKAINGVKSPQWWKHLRDWKRTFWKRHRSKSNVEIRKEVRG